MKHLMPVVVACALVMPAQAQAQAQAQQGQAHEYPLVRDFVGLNGHTVQFRPGLYAPTGRLVRDYHPVQWDLGDDTSTPTNFPWAQNRVNWDSVYDAWQDHGFTTHAALMLVYGPEDWTDIEADAYAYGQAFAAYAGPSHGGLVTSASVGNEPGNYDDATYRRVFESMAHGLREGDPELLIATCAANVGESTRYSKSLDCFEGLEDLVDVITIHDYAEVEGWPTWRRTYPEDPEGPFLAKLEQTLTWRDDHMPDTPVWVCEFGWDSTTQPNATQGTFVDWVGNTDLEQAQYLVRGYLTLMAHGADRAYMYFFNDSDQASVHAASGLTRNFEPKPSYHAVAHLLQTLADYRLIQTHEDADLWRYDFVHANDPTREVWVLWSPTGDGIALNHTVAFDGCFPVRIQHMPTQAGDAPQLNWAQSEMPTSLDVSVSESPTYVHVTRTRSR